MHIYIYIYVSPLDSPLDSELWRWLMVAVSEEGKVRKDEFVYMNHYN